MRIKKEKRIFIFLLLIILVIPLIDTKIQLDPEKTSKINPVSLKLNALDYIYEFNTSWGGIESDESYGITIDIENNIILSGYTKSYAIGDKDIVIIKFDNNGLQIWNKTWGGSDIDEAFDITTDDYCNIYIAGRTNNLGAGSADVIFLKYSKNGDLLWNKTWGGVNNDIANAINIDEKGNVYITGKTSSFGSGNFDIFLLKYNVSGSLKYSKYWGTTYDDVAFSLDFDSDNNIYIAGYRYYNSISKDMVILLKYNENGTLIKTYGFGHYAGDWYCYDLKCSFNDMIILVGCQNSFGQGGNDVFIFAFNTNLDNIWDHSWGGIGDDIAYAIEIDRTGNIYVAGKTNSFGSGNYDYFLLYYDIYNTQKWAKTFGYVEDNTCYDLAIDYKNDLLLIGNIDNIGAGIYDIFLVKLWTSYELPISIDDLDNKTNWNRTALLYNWCEGEGTQENPYLIKNIRIDGFGRRNCIEIRNSNTHFIIENCTFFNAGMTSSLPYSYYKGIYLSNVSNGEIVNNTISPDNGHGFYLENCYNITLQENIVSNNYYSGIHLENSNWNKLIQNEANSNTHPLGNSDGYGIWLGNSNYNNLFNNTTNFNKMNGLKNYGNYNNITLLTANYNGIDHISEGGVFDNHHHNNYINCTFIGNKFSGIYIQSSGHHITVDGCEFLNNDNAYGILIWALSPYSSNYHTIVNNTFSGNFIGLGLRAPTGECSYNIISNNKFQSHISQAIYLQDANYNYFFNNYFFGKKIYFLGTNNNYWNNSYIGNYWDNYNGVDDNDDGIGDTPYVLSQGIDYLPIYHDGPNLTIIKPYNNTFYSNPPEFNIKIIDPILDKKWYTLDGSPIKYFYNQNETINATGWSNCLDGEVFITFYANDTFGNLKAANILVKKDTSPPIINIITPSDNNPYEQPPFFNLELLDPTLNSTWYTINENNTKYFFSGTSGNIGMLAWTSVSEGDVDIIFYANDSFNQINSKKVTIIKDITPPFIVLYSPKNGDIFYNTAPSFNISIIDDSLENKWYQFENLSRKFYFSGSTGNIDERTWDLFTAYGNVTLTFYAEDSLGRISSVDVEILKVRNPGASEDLGTNLIFGYNQIFILGIILVGTIILVIKFKNKVKRK